MPRQSAVELAQTPLWGGEDFQHPQATHQILLGSARVAYQLERSSRRSIGFQVGVDGLRIRAPRWVSLVQLEAALQEKSRWILEKLREQHLRSSEVATSRISWAHGAVLDFCGGKLTLHLHSAAPRGGSLLALAPSQWALHLPIDPTAPEAQIRAGVAAWWLREARQRFTERLNYFAPQVGVQWRSLRLSNARTRWGSAKSDGSIMLNWRLLHCAPELQDYVVVHELAHLQVMDHSARFWGVVARTQPDYAQRRQLLKVHVSPIW